MATRDKSPQMNRSFSFYLLLFMIVLVLCLVGILTVNEYLYTKYNFNRESHNLEVQTEKNVEAAIRLADTATNILDNSMNDRMREGLLGINAEYERSGHDPSRMDLAAIQKNLGEGFDIYIIDENGVIVNTTYLPELGQDFREIPYFYTYLTKIRNSEGFFPDRVVHELLGPDGPGNMPICLRQITGMFLNSGWEVRRSIRSTGSSTITRTSETSSWQIPMPNPMPFSILWAGILTIIPVPANRSKTTSSR